MFDTPILRPIDVSKNCLLSGQQCWPRSDAAVRRLIWVYTVCTSLSVCVFWVNMVQSCLVQNNSREFPDFSLSVLFTALSFYYSHMITDFFKNKKKLDVSVGTLKAQSLTVVHTQRNIPSINYRIFPVFALSKPGPTKGLLLHVQSSAENPYAHTQAGMRAHKHTHMVNHFLQHFVF